MVTFKVLFCLFVLSECQNLFTSARSRNMRRCFDCVSVKSCESAVKFATMLHQGSLPEEQRETFYKAVCGYDAYEPNVPKVCCSDFPMIKTAAMHPRMNRGSSEETNLEDSIETHPNVDLLPSICGGIDGRRIINGHVAKLYEFPWMALIAYNTSIGTQFHCGGSVINSRYILTAAHCTINVYTGEFKKIAGVRIGEIDYNTDFDCQGSYPDRICESKIQDMYVEKIIPHENFFAQQPKADIALLRLADPITMYKNAAPICLPVYSELRNVNLTGLNGTVAGWGATEKETQSTILLKVQVPINTDGACAHDNNNGILCAGEELKDSCEGDSGGPLMVESDFNGSIRQVQYGIVSRGPRTCGSENPGVYTDVSKYMDWILDNIRK